MRAETESQLASTMTANLARLVSAGFESAGNWSLGPEGLELDLKKAVAGERDVLYAFAVDDALTYVGKTALTLRERMQRYKTPAKKADNAGSTNIKNNCNIIAALRDGKSVEIYVLKVHDGHRHGEFVVSVTAGLELNLINELMPPWNGRQVAAPAAIKRQPIVKLSYSARTEPRLTKIDFQNALSEAFDDASSAGVKHIDIRSGTLHTKIGAYPGPGHSMPTCCSAMYGAMKPGDEIREAPPKGRGANLVIRYNLPRLSA